MGPQVLEYLAVRQILVYPLASESVVRYPHLKDGAGAVANLNHYLLHFLIGCIASHLQGFVESKITFTTLEYCLGFLVDSGKW